MSIVLRIRPRTPDGHAPAPHVDYGLDSMYTLREADELLQDALQHNIDISLLLENGDILDVFPDRIAAVGLFHFPDQD